MKTKEKKLFSLQPYYTFGLPLLLLMGLIALSGVALEVLMHFVF